MTRARTGAVLVTGATGRVGRLVVDELLRAGVPVRALTRRPEQAALPAGAEVVVGDLTVPASLDAALQGIGAVFLVWTAAPATAPAVVARLATHALGQRRRVVYLSSPHQTSHPFFQQPNSLRGLHAEVERLLVAARQCYLNEAATARLLAASATDNQPVRQTRAATAPSSAPGPSPSTSGRSDAEP